MLKKRLAAFLIILLIIAPVYSFASSGVREQKINQIKQVTGFNDPFLPPELGTVPLPESKEMAYPYPNGQAKLKVQFPKEVEVNEDFDISVIYETTSNPFTALVLLHQLFIPNGIGLPSNWRQINISPWAPEDNMDLSGTIDNLPSLNWVIENWNYWYGVGLAPHNNGNLLIHSSQGWSHGHYFFALAGDTVTLTHGPYKINQAGDYQFEIAPSGWYMESPHYFTSDLEPVSFNIQAKESQSPIKATVDIKPESLNIKSKGKMVTAYIEMPGNLNPREIDVNSIRIQNQISPLPEPTAIGDYNNNGIDELMVKFDRASLIELIFSQQGSSYYNLTVTGYIGTTQFIGQDSLKIIQ